MTEHQAGGLPSNGAGNHASSVPGISGLWAQIERMLN